MTANNKIHEVWMKAAIREAISAFKNNEVPIGAIVVHEERIIGKRCVKNQNASSAASKEIQLSFGSYQRNQV